MSYIEFDILKLYLTYLDLFLSINIQKMTHFLRELDVAFQEVFDILKEEQNFSKTIIRH